MKRLFFALAAAFALASCVEENAFVPEQKEEGKVIIEALATKTLLDGTNVVWEADDHIAVAFQMAEPVVQDFAATSASGASATFSGNFAAGSETAEGAFAVYPYEHVTVDGGVLKISHNLPAEQDGVVDSDLNLSFAELDLEDLKDGKASANFKNALTLLKVVVPAGVKEVSLTSNSETLVGDAEFYAPQLGEMGRKSVSNGGKTVTLTKGGSDLEGTHYLLVYPANTNGLDLRMVGSDDTVYESTAASIKFLPSEYRTIDLTKVFKMDVQATAAVSPVGGELVIPVAAAEQYTYTVDIDGDPSWISVQTSTYVQTKAFAGTNIVFDVEANTTGSPRSAEVTITWGTDGEKTFTVTQENAYLDFVYVDPADPESGLIQWQETFGVYADEACATEAKANISNVFTIDISDDFNKGAYMVMNMFKDLNTGAKYYADYNVTTKKLTVYTSSAKAPSRTYYFADESVVLVYDPSAKTFTSEKNPIPAQTKYDFTGFKDKSCYLGNYSVAVKAVDPGSGFDVSSLYGTYNESVKAPYSSGSTETLVISESDNPSYDLKMLFFYTSGESSYSYETAYGKVSGDGKTITVTIPGNSNFYGPVSDFTLTVNGNVISGSYCGNMDYSAEKPAGFDVSSLYGEYTETFTGYWPAPGTTVISESDDNSYDVKIIFFKPQYGSTMDTAYGKVNSTGTVITIDSFVSNLFGPLSSFDVQVDGANLSSNYGGALTYTATKK